MRFEWLAWVLVFIQVVLYALGTYERIITMFVQEFVSAAVLYGYIIGSGLWLASTACVIVLALSYLVEQKDDEE